VQPVAWRGLALAERLAGNLRTHIFYATRAGFDTVARPEDTSAIPVLREMDAQKLASGLQPGTPLDLVALRARVTQVAPSASVDDHRAWIERMRSMTNATVLAGLGILALVIVDRKSVV